MRRAGCAIAALAAGGCSTGYSSECEFDVCGQVSVSNVDGAHAEVSAGFWADPTGGTGDLAAGCYGVLISASPPSSLLDAGKFTVASGAGPSAVPREPSGGYRSTVDVASGQPIGLAVGGADVPGFSASIAVPQAGTVLAPVAPPGGVLTVTAGAEIPLAWSPTDSETVQALISYPIAGQEWVMACNFPAAAGQGTVKTEALGGGMHVSSTAGLVVPMYVRAMNRADVIMQAPSHPKYWVTVRASAAEAWPSGDTYIVLQIAP